MRTKRCLFSYGMNFKLSVCGVWRRIEHAKHFSRMKDVHSSESTEYRLHNIFNFFITFVYFLLFVQLFTHNDVHAIANTLILNSDHLFHISVGACIVCVWQFNTNKSAEYVLALANRSIHGYARYRMDRQTDVCVLRIRISYN